MLNIMHEEDLHHSCVLNSTSIKQTPSIIQENIVVFVICANIYIPPVSKLYVGVAPSNMDMDI